MDNHFYFIQWFQLVELLVAAGIIYWAASLWRTQPEGTVARWLRHRDRIWFALLVMYVPTVILQYLFFHLFWSHPTVGMTGTFRVTYLIYTLFHGIFYGVAGCWFASPARKSERFPFWLALVMAVALYFLNVGLSYIVFLFHRPGLPLNLYNYLAAAVVVAYGLKRLIVRGNPIAPPEEVVDASPAQAEARAASTIGFLLLGLAPIPILLIVAAPNQSNHSAAPFIFAVCVVLNLVGGIGCLSGMKNPGARILLGILLGAFFCFLSLLVAVLEACSHSGGI